MHCRKAEDKKKLTTRLRRIEGQIRGIEKMIDLDKDCIEIVRQINSASSALHSVWAEVVSAHMKHCIKDALKRGDEKLIDELANHLKKVR
ncbi:MAG: metal-sensitive transcriptional regulator [Opitutales bacterium]|nr:metal-sensitive transcriptional regulator [Opitutales bacterium]